MKDNNKRTILVVEDEPFVQMLLRDFLEEENYAVFSANDAQTALDLLRAEREIALLLTDVGLPDMNGRALADAARKVRPSLPILFATGYGDEHEGLREPLDIRMAIIAKPFDMQRLAQVIRSLLQDK
jgi:CheY-like chemotaxis protein